MRTFAMMVAFGFTMIGITQVWEGAANGGAVAGEGVSLLKLLGEWKYPDSKILDGATMSDGGNPELQSIKCDSILTTGDSVAKVFEFYSKKLGIDQDPKAALKAGDSKSDLSQDDSKGRPVSVRVIVVNKADSSTTLVISRGAGEKETHIAWSHYLRLNGKK